MKCQPMVALQCLHHIVTQLHITINLRRRRIE